MRGWRAGFDRYRIQQRAFSYHMNVSATSPSQPSPASGRGECTECARPHYASNMNKHALARADRKIIRRCAGGSCIRKVPPFMIVIGKSLFAHGREEHVSPAARFGADGGTRGVA